jgi:F-box domain
MSIPHLFSLSNELIIEIISNLCPVDIYACRCTCRRLNRIIINSHLIQYIMRTALSGVFDPLEPGLLLPDRLDALERWETAWMEMDLRESDAIIDAPVSTESAPMPGRGFLSGQYFIMCHERIGAPAIYSFLDMHATSSHTNAACWTTIEIDTPVLAFAFASELNLAVVISCVNLPVSAHSFSSGTLINSYHVGHRPMLSTRKLP